MKPQTKSIALFDDRSPVANAVRLYFQKELGFSVLRVYSRDELSHKMKNTPFDFVICPSRLHLPVPPQAGREKGEPIFLYWHLEHAGDHSRSPLRNALQFEIETLHASLSYTCSPSEPLEEQFQKLSRLLLTIRKYQRDFITFRDDAEILQTIVEDGSAAVLHLVRNRIRWMNREALRVLGRSERELLGSAFSSLFPGDGDYRDALGQVARHRDPGGWGTASCSLARKDGEVVDCTIRIRRLNPMNPDKGSLVFIEDDRDRKRLEGALATYGEKIARNEAKYLEIFRNLNLVVIRTDLSGSITFWNSLAESVFGFSAAAVSGNNIIDTIADPGSRTARDIAVLLYDSGAVRDHTVMHVLENRRMDGTYVWVAWNTLMFRDSSGRASGILWIGQDISDYGPGGDPGGRQASWKEEILDGTDVREEVFDILFHAAIELGRGGRESRKIGTSFLIGDAERVMANSRQCLINAFEGKDTAQRMVQDRETIENIKNLSLMDGAFVIDGSGLVQASSRHLLAPLDDTRVREGHGTRHASVAAMTQITRSVGIVVSESGGTVTIYRGGAMVKEFAV
ncbi:MAG TPA: PAS domain S-box protein [Methanoregulaceae archaeon]|nr:MAG: PAS domain S-box protein [Methanolinea sp.]HON82211.1 PAS domain S-box protein [Methanoregulaceae archaeon]HPD09986.1 PAS domain S-box protein [Methanoregulaceae archaeon]HRT14991.1 PAS domain S-box protein [Methanoregulaceae archaeon]HRU30563.1 PAS domain S-box protein [Methanoregulaceae archaeon]